MSQRRESLLQQKEAERFHEEALESEQAGQGSLGQGSYRAKAGYVLSPTVLEERLGEPGERQLEQQLGVRPHVPPWSPDSIM